jgi:hypothetical protein
MIWSVIVSSGACSSLTPFEQVGLGNDHLHPTLQDFVRPHGSTTGNAPLASSMPFVDATTPNGTTVTFLIFVFEITSSLRFLVRAIL